MTGISHASTSAVAAPAPPPLAAISARGLSRRYGEVHAVAGVDLTVCPGEVVAFLGPNGAGKTSLIDMVLGLGRPDEGEVEVFGLRPRAAVERGLVSAVLQSGGLLPDLTVREIVELTGGLFAQSLPPEQILSFAGIAHLAGRKVRTCSGGEQQRIRFAMALVNDPLLLVLDEPTTGMDVEGRRRFWGAIHADAQAGRTVLFATHYLEEADTYADRIVLMSHGRIVADGTVAQIRSTVAGRKVRATLEDADEAAVRTALAGLKVADVEVRGSTLMVTTDDSDGVAHVLLRDRLAHDLEIMSPGLDDAFLALTGDVR
ncbi:Daunorubicin/doxorubicin resistance ATP-binding protein DrrA [Austwickia sp. TVS 96-490-7B]|uniref:ABC transporter ATP-binding protein n=1 Tax=Austwickia sp. TVS 96-490-7B TaxID=2830843 RepID=UPI001C59B766|nr:ABC transporter ATP-binding protein [Austwickia sp. TVS 96-490-7B]MBW3084058.1 Daunorubicin/doxorubicin resistance ATP-binding protein DrrA [Austwickia sp. TVS 96-490-7B]